MTFGYARVSTKTQARDGNSLDAQQAALSVRRAGKINIPQQIRGYFTYGQSPLILADTSNV